MVIFGIRNSLTIQVGNMIWSSTYSQANPEADRIEKYFSWLVISRNLHFSLKET